MRTLIVRSPVTGDVVGEVGAATPDDARRAVRESATALHDWSRRPPRERAEVLRSCWGALVAARDDLAELIVAENGKPRPDAEAEVTYAAEFFRWNSEEAVRLDGRIGTLPGGGRQLVVHQPIGVVLAVTPWNLPAAMLARKFAPALAAGCGVVAKPAPATPLTALALVDLMRGAGVPDDLVQVLPTLDDEGLVRAALDEPAVRKLSFTGSTATGSRLLGLAANRVVSCAMELGGNAPFIVTADADIEAALDAAVVAKLRHNSQACTAANRFLVARSVAEEFTAGLVQRFEAADIGPLIDERAALKVDRLVSTAVDAGGRIRLGGRRRPGAGNHFCATVLDRVTPINPILDEEIFGPVAPVVAVPDDDDAIVELANATDLGLAAYVCSGDLQRALQIADRLEAGMVGINRGIVSDPAAPFGGVKSSGIGREGGHDGVLAFCEPKLIVTDW